MKKKLSFTIVTMLLTAMIVNVSSNAFANEMRTSKPYHFIHIKGEMNIKIVQNETPGVLVEGTDDQIDNTITILRNDTLFVYQNNVRKGDRKVRMVINVQDLVAIEVSGNTNVNCSGLVNADYITIKATEGAKIKMDVRALKVESKVTGCSSIILEGSAASIEESKDACSTIDIQQLDVIESNANPVICPGC